MSFEIYIGEYNTGYKVDYTNNILIEDLYNQIEPLKKELKIDGLIWIKRVDKKSTLWYNKYVNKDRRKSITISRAKVPWSSRVVMANQVHS